MEATEYQAYKRYAQIQQLFEQANQSLQAECDTVQGRRDGVLAITLAVPELTYILPNLNFRSLQHQLANHHAQLAVSLASIQAREHYLIDDYHRLLSAALPNNLTKIVFDLNDSTAFTPTIPANIEFKPQQLSWLIAQSTDQAHQQFLVEIGLKQHPQRTHHFPAIAITEFYFNTNLPKVLIRKIYQDRSQLPPTTQVIVETFTN